MSCREFNFVSSVVLTGTHIEESSRITFPADDVAGERSLSKKVFVGSEVSDYFLLDP